MHFTKETFEFLTDLTANNNRGWFVENKSRYVEDVQMLGLALIADVAKPLRKVAPFIVANPAKSGGSMTRVYRDTRFSKDKTPYKTYVGMHLRHEAGKDIHAPGIYLHFALDECFVAAGCYQPEPSALAKIRAAIDSDAKLWTKVLGERKFRESYSLWGDSLKTAPRDYSKDHPQINDLKRKHFIGVSPLSRDLVLSDTLVPTIIERAKAARSFMRFLCESIGVPY